VAYDVGLADRIRSVLAGIDGAAGATEKKMFGGLAFLIGGNMAVSASGEGGLLLRADPAASEALCAHPGVERAVMRGRAMDGWLRVDDSAIASRDELERWVRIGVEYAGSLPPK
jgi:TfoX/Sxy family transcriptional regulator of competence genes